MTAMKGAPAPSAKERERFMAVAIEAAQAAGAILTDYARRGFHIERKTHQIDLITDADRASERAILERIRAEFPDHEVLAEEGGLSAARSAAYRWVVDPLDGTTNFAHGLPIYAVSIGLEHDGRLIAGVVWDPARRELFVGELGRGATMNGAPLRVSATASLNEALLVTGFAYNIRETRNNLDHFSRFSVTAQGVRRLGAAALDLCYVAAGRMDGFWEMSLHPWDVAAGALIVTEAGGRMSDFSGSAQFSIYGKELVASNGRIHDAMLKVLADI